MANQEEHHDSENKNIQDLISEYENLFQDRYSDLDPDYLLTRDLPLPPPPCVENWYSKPKRTYDWTRNDHGQRGHGGYGRRSGFNYGHDRHNDRRHYNQDNRSSGQDRSYNRDYRRDHRGHGDRDSHKNYGSNRVHYAGQRDSSQSNQRKDRYRPYHR